MASFVSKKNASACNFLGIPVTTCKLEKSVALDFMQSVYQNNTINWLHESDTLTIQNYSDKLPSVYHTFITQCDTQSRHQTVESQRRQNRQNLANSKKNSFILIVLKSKKKNRKPSAVVHMNSDMISQYSSYTWIHIWIHRSWNVTYEFMITKSYMNS